MIGFFETFQVNFYLPDMLASENQFLVLEDLEQLKE